MHYRQFLHPKSGCASYLLGCGRAGAAAAIDPVGPVEAFLQEAEGAGCRITHVIETHSHADHRLSALELAEASGSDLYMYRGMPARFPFKPLDNEEELNIGSVHLRVLHTPGHTPDSELDRGRSSPGLGTLVRPYRGYPDGRRCGSARFDPGGRDLRARPGASATRQPVREDPATR